MSGGWEVLEEYKGVRVMKSSTGDGLPLYVVDESLKAGELLKKLLEDETLEEISYNGPSQGIRVYHKRHGFCTVAKRFTKEEGEELVDFLLSESGLSRAHPIVEGILRDGSRFSIVFEPVAVDGPCFSIRKFPRHNPQLVELVRNGTVPIEVAALLRLYIDGLGGRPANVIIAGGTGTGKTTLLAALAQLIPPRSRIVVIEDTPELKIDHPNVVRLTVPPLQYGHQISMETLLRASLRLRPDRIIVGEVRGRETETLLAAMNTGHPGSMGTIHANTSFEAVKRLTMPPMNVPPQMLNAIDLIITTSMFRSKGVRRVVFEVAEVAGSDEQGPRLNTLYKFNPQRGEAVSTGVPSAFKERFAASIGLTKADFEKLLAKMVEEYKKMIGAGVAR